MLEAGRQPSFLLGLKLGNGNELARVALKLILTYNAAISRVRPLMFVLDLLGLG